MLAVIPPGITSKTDRHLADNTGDVTSQDDLWHNPMDTWEPTRNRSFAGRLARRLGVKCRLHDLRHFIVTQLVAGGWTGGPSLAGPAMPMGT